MGVKKLRTQCVCTPEMTVLANCFQFDEVTGNTLISHAFATVWDYVPSGGKMAVLHFVQSSP